MVNDLLLDESVTRAIRASARRSHSAQRGYLELDDLMQEGYVYVMDNEARVSEWLGYGKEGSALLHHALYQHMHKATMRERYLKDGTKPGDYYQYRKEVIIELLPEMFDGEPLAVASSSDLNAVIRSPKQPSEGGDRMAMIADMQYAYKRVNDYDKGVLSDRYADGGLAVELMAAARDITPRTMQSHIDRAVRNMAKHVGGEAPRSRKAISNMEAQMITRAQG